MLLTGTFVRSLDEKQRVAIPKRLREAMQPAQSGGLYVAPGTDGSLAVYTEETLRTLAQRLTAVSPTGQDVRAFSRLFYAQAERVELDSQGRIRLPPALVELAGLGKEVVLLGVHDHLELWDRQRWEVYLAEKSASYDVIAERAFGDSG
jgi:MraZ protein